MATEYSIETRDLHHTFQHRQEVLRGVDLCIRRSSIAALLGLNGAGKTTLLRSLMGLIHPHAGTIDVLGHRLGKGNPPPGLLARLGYVPERPIPADRITAGGLLALVREVHPRWDEQTVRRYLRIFHIPLEARCRDLSAGTKAQLALTLAMAGRPELLVLDEPTMGLDPLHRHQYLQLLLDEATAREMTILLTSHDLHQIERMADSVAILHDGRLVVQEPLDELKEHVKRIRVGAAEPRPDLAAALAALPGVADVQPEPWGYLLSAIQSPDELRTRIEALPGVAGVQVLGLSLEEIFLIYCGA